MANAKDDDEGEEAAGNGQAEALTAAAEPVSGEESSKPDYRLDFTEVEGTLEAVPEEAPAASIMAIQTEVPAAPPQLAAASTPAAVTRNNSSVYITVPESNASDVAFSEYSFQAESLLGAGANAGYLSNIARTSEPLSARQQVALWLTRTSMSDVSSVPSLRSLFFGGGRPSSTTSSIRGHYQAPADQHHRRSRGERYHRRRTSDILRNQSSRSLVSHARKAAAAAAGSAGGPNMAASPHMRKCNTLSSLSKSAPTPNRVSGSAAQGSRRQPLAIFRRLAGNSGGGSGRSRRSDERRGGREMDLLRPAPPSGAETAPPSLRRQPQSSVVSFTSVGSGESPFKVRLADYEQLNAFLVVVRSGHAAH